MTPPADPRAFLARLRRRAAATAVVAFGAFFGLAAVNIVGVTAHAATVGRQATGGQATASPSAAVPATLAPGDFFGRPGGLVAGNGSGVAQAPLPPLLVRGGGAPMLSSGSS